MTLLIGKTVLRGEGIKTEHQITKTFEEADRDGDGNLNSKELQHAFHKLGAHVPPWRAYRGLHHADINNDGVIRGEEELNNLIKYAVNKYGYN